MINLTVRVFLFKLFYLFFAYLSVVEVEPFKISQSSQWAEVTDLSVVEVYHCRVERVLFAVNFNHDKPYS